MCRNSVHTALLNIAVAGETFTTFVEPSGLLVQQTRADFARVFGTEYEHVASLSDDELRAEFAHGYGEVDAHVQVTLGRGLRLPYGRSQGSGRTPSQ